MYSIYLLPILAGTILAQTQYTSTAVEAVKAAQATARTSSPTSNVVGKTFDRFATIWCENTDFDIAAGDPNFAWIATQGITLTNYHGVIHPSQPNYVAAVGGDTHGVKVSSKAYYIKPDVRTIVDLLEEKYVSWAEYQEDMPYSGFEGNWSPPEKKGRNDYVRKHNPLMSYDSVTSKEERLAQIKNFTMFEEDMKNEKLPQWMFITPNMTHNGHDSNVMVAGQWARSFLEPLLKNSNFLGRTLVLLTFDESEVYTGDNKVFSVLLGDAVPADKQGTKDDTFYNHYSQLATVEKNWDLGNLGLNDVDANAFF